MCGIILFMSDTELEIITPEELKEEEKVIQKEEEKTLVKEEKKKRRLTIKQRKWVKEYLRTGNATEAAKLAYNCSSESAHQIGWENLQKLDYQELLERAGITDAKLLQVLDDGLSAYQVDRSGNVRKDHSTIHKYLETGLKLKKRLEAKESTGNTLIGLSIVVRK